MPEAFSVAAKVLLFRVFRINNRIGKGVLMKQKSRYPISYHLGVITSYSIHYTKLYDFPATVDYEWLDQEVKPSRRDGRIVRITSYNVCYTKLLRKLLHSENLCR